jgi:urease accessory protein
MYLSSPALPIGGFAWSRGLEAAVHSGTLQTLEDLFDFLALGLTHSLGRLDLPLLGLALQAAASYDYGALSELNDLSLAARESLEFALEETEGGKAAKRLALSLGLWPEGMDPDFAPGLTVGQALLAVALGLGPADALPVLECFAFAWLQNQIAAAARTMKLGQSQLQGLLLALGPTVSEVALQAADLGLGRTDPARPSLAEIAQAAIGPGLPGLAILSAHHESQAGRLFRS